MGSSLLFADLEHAIQNQSPDCAALICAYLAQSDPPEDRPEEGLPDDQDPPQLPDGTWTMRRFRDALGSTTFLPDDERRARENEAWAGILAAPYSPPRLRLGSVLEELYEQDTPWARSVLMEVFAKGRLGWGSWQAFKRVYKLAEERHDTQLFGLMTCRLDRLESTAFHGSEIAMGTRIYLRRRAWRYLRQLGESLPELFPSFAVEVLRHYPRASSSWDQDVGKWVAFQICQRKDLEGMDGTSYMDLTEDESKRAFPEAWKLSADPHLDLLLAAESQSICKWGIACLKKDHPKVLQKLPVSTLIALAERPVESVQELVLALLKDNADYHQSKLRKLGLHEAVLGWLLSESQSASTFALEYARTYADDLSLKQVLELLEKGNAPVQKFAVGLLEKFKPKELSALQWIDLIGNTQTSKLAQERFLSNFSVSDIDDEAFVRLSIRGSTELKFLASVFQAAKKQIPARLLCALLDDERCGYAERRRTLKELAERKGSEIDLEWIRAGLDRSELAREIGAFLRGGMYTGSELGLDWLKSLLNRRVHRELAFELLSDRKLVSPAQLGVPWLLRLATREDEQLRVFALRCLFEHFKPEDFSEGAATKEAGVSALFALATDKGEATSRAFAQRYLTLHHPICGPQLPEATSLGIKPCLSADDYSHAILAPLLNDSRLDVRKFASQIAPVQVLVWDARELLFEMVASSYREPRAQAAEILLQIGQADVDAKLVPPTSWLDSERVFALAESPIKVTREVAVTLISRHYDLLQGAQRLAWLMESPDRDVALFAVRLLWENHRPSAGKPTVEEPKALLDFLRVTLFGLPPGRMERRELKLGAGGPARSLPASQTKVRLVELVRDLAVEDEEFAKLITGMLEEFMASRGKQEWQACVAALARIRKAHPGIVKALPEARSLNARSASEAVSP